MDSPGSFLALATVVLILVMVFTCESLCLRLFLNKKKGREDARLERLYELFTESIWGNVQLSLDQIPKELLDIPNMVHVIEKIDETLSDSNWKQIRTMILSEYLLPWARKEIRSTQWNKKSHAMRVFYLEPEAICEEDLISSLEDSVYFIRILAAKCVKHFPSEKYVGRIIGKLISEPPSSHYPYVHSIVQAGEQALECVKQIYRKSLDDREKLICLKILAKTLCVDMASIVFQNDEVSSPELKKAKLEFLAQQPCQSSIDYVANQLKDADSAVRAAAVDALEQLVVFVEGTEEMIQLLEMLLSDASENIRFQSARILCQLGNKGKRVLSSQDHDLSPAAFEAARFAITYNG